MASGNGGRSTGAPGDGGNGRGGQAPLRGGPHRSRVVATIDWEVLSRMLDGHDRLREVSEEYLTISTREHELLHRINGQLEGQVAVLQQQVAILTAELNLRRGESSTVPRGDSKP